MRLRYAAVLLAVLAAGCLAVVSAASIGSSKARASTGVSSAWSTRYAKGSVRLHGMVPRAVATHATRSVAPLASNAKLTLGFALPLHNMAGLNALIAREAKTHVYLTRAQLRAQFAPSKAQFHALRQ